MNNIRNRWNKEKNKKNKWKVFMEFKSKIIYIKIKLKLIKQT